MKQKMNFILNFILHTNFAKSFLSRDFRFAVPPYFRDRDRDREGVEFLLVPFLYFG